MKAAKHICQVLNDKRFYENGHAFIIVHNAISNLIRWNQNEWRDWKLEIKHEVAEYTIIHAMDIFARQFFLKNGSRYCQ